MTHCYIYGASGHNKVVFHTFASMGKTISAFLDDNPTHGNHVTITAGATVPSAADISEGMIWVCTEATMPKFTGS